MNSLRYILLIFFSISMLGCSEVDEIIPDTPIPLVIMGRGIELNPTGLSPLTANISIETNYESIYEVVIKGKNKDDIRYGSDQISTEHTVPVKWLYSGTNNTVQIFCYRDGSTEKDSVEYLITTEDIPENMPEVEILIDDLDSDQYKLFLVERATGSGVEHFVFDRSGEIRWYIQSAYEHLQPIEVNSDNNFYCADSSKDKVFEIDWLGNKLLSITLPEPYINVHHDIVEMPNGNFLLTVVDEEQTKLEGVKSLSLESDIIEIDRDGTLVKVWDLDSIVRKYVEPGDSSVVDERDDWCHINGLVYDQAENSIIISSRNALGLFKIDYDSGDIKWILGDKNKPWFKQPRLGELALSLEVGSDVLPPLGQHSPVLLSNGNIALFDNGNDAYDRKGDEDGLIDGGRGFSRIVKYNIDESNMIATQNYQYGRDRGEAFYSPYISEVDALDQDRYFALSGMIDHVLMGSGDGFTKGRVIILENEEVVFEALIKAKIKGETFYRGEALDRY